MRAHLTHAVQPLSAFAALRSVACASVLAAALMAAPAARAQDAPTGDAPAAAPAAPAPAAPAAAAPAEAPAAAATPAAGEPAKPVAKARKKKSAKGQKVESGLRPASSASLEARHKICLDFIQRHGKSCDPWVEPTCGYDIGYMRPMECVAP